MVQRFNKPGRPREDAVARRLEIFEAVAPLLRQGGVRELSMQRAARAAHVSVGTLYHYFPNKRALVLYGINPEPANHVCRRFEPTLPLTDRQATRFAVAGFLVETIDLMRASVNAAIELGPEVLRRQLDEVAARPVEQFGSVLERALSPDDPRSVEQVERLVRQTVVSAVMQKRFEPGELRDQFAQLLSHG